jgi:hypothetical protein
VVGSPKEAPRPKFAPLRLTSNGTQDPKDQIQMHPLQEAFPDPEILLSLPPEELAGVLLQILKRQGRNLSGYNFVTGFYQMHEVYPHRYVDRVGKAVMEAWTWMISAGLLAPDPRQMSGDWVFLTRRAKAITDQTAFEQFRKASALPRELLHPVIADHALPNFIRGDLRRRRLPGVQASRGGGA